MSDCAPIAVFVDTSAVKHSIRAREVVKFGRGIVSIDPTRKVTNRTLQHEIECLSKIAHLARSKKLRLIWDFETSFEFLGIYPLGGGRPELIDAGIEQVPGPVEYSRMLAPMYPHQGTWKLMQVEFVASLRSPRFMQLRRACGADQRTARPNQLMDAYHLWCAEHAHAEYFLTTDFKLCNVLARQKQLALQLTVATPSALLTAVSAPGSE